MDKTITGLLSLPESLLCKKEVLGKTYVANISGNRINLSFPVCPEIDPKKPQIGINNPLLPPEIAQTWKKGGSSLDWGCLLEYPSCDCAIGLLAVSIKSKPDQTDTVAKQIYNAIEKWEYSFTDYLKLETKQKTTRNKNLHRESCTLELAVDKKYIPKKTIIPFYVSIPDKDEFASEMQVLGAIRFADSGKELYPEWQMMLTAYDARRDNQNRLAIVNACSALEICLVNYILTRCQELGFDADLFLESKFRSLGDRIKLAKNLDPAFSKDNYEKKIVKPRNDIAHNRDINPTDETTDVLLSSVEECLEHFLGRKYYDE